MALTRPKAAQVNFDITNINDSCITLNMLESPPVNNATDIGIIAIRGSGETNTAIIWDELLDEIACVETAEVGIASGNMVFTGYTDLQINDLNVADITATSISIYGQAPLIKIIDDLAPQLGTDLDVNGQQIVSVDGAHISLAPGWYHEDEYINEQKLLASDGEISDWFGYSVSIYGDTAIVGAYRDYVGAAYIFVKTNDVWSEQQKLTASDAQLDDQFGYSVAIYSDTVIVGARGVDTGGVDTGAVYVFTRSGVTWTEEQKIHGVDTQTGDWFGTSVSIYGDTVIVGAPGADTGADNTGAAYVFTWTGATWTEQQKIQASDRGLGDWFGTSVSIYGDTVVVGSYEGDTEEGAVYVFTRTDTTWTEQQKLIASDRETDDRFGTSVAIYGDTVIVGAAVEDTGGVAAGAAYIFTRTTDIWTEQQKLLASDAEIADNFGRSVSIYGDTVIVGAALEDTGGAEAGAAYIFTRSGTTWTEQQKLMASDIGVSGNFGISVSIYDGVIISGASIHATAGAAYVYDVTRISSTINIGEHGYSPIVKFFEHTPGINFVGLRAPNTIIENNSWVLPQDDPSVVDGYYLTTDVLGVMSFVMLTGSEMGEVVDDLTPQLGGDLDVNGKSIVSVTNGDIILAPDGTGTVIISNETALQFAESVGNGTNYVALIAPTSITTSRTWVLPQEDPSTAVGKLLTTDASGVMSFSGMIDGESY